MAFVDVSAMRADFWVKPYKTVKQYNMHFNAEIC